jgi:hypothetical protein
MKTTEMRRSGGRCFTLSKTSVFERAEKTLSLLQFIDMNAFLMGFALLNSSVERMGYYSLSWAPMLRFFLGGIFI